MCSVGHGGPRSPVVFSKSTVPVVLEALSRFVPPKAVRAALVATGRTGRRIRRVPAAAVVWLIVGIGLWSDRDLPAIWRQIVGPLRSLMLVLALQRPPCKSALSAARRRVGPRPLRRLFVQTRRSLADGRTPGAFYHGMRLKVIDGLSLKVPDTAGNAAAFGRGRTTRGGEPVNAGYPQIHTLLLSEAGTHVLLEAVIKPMTTAEFPLADDLLRHVAPGELVLWDRGFYGYRALDAAQQRHTHVLGRVGAHVTFERVRTLGDGSYRAVIYPTWKDRRHGTKGLIVRVIEYTLDDPNRPGHGERHRLVTTLLDADAHPARELVVLYHERWEIEIGNDELKTHQLNRRVELRSRTPCGVVQEFYGIVLAYNAVRSLMHEAAVSVNIDPRQLSFIHAVRVIRETVPLLRAAAAVDLPRLYAGMIAHIAARRLPPRDNRVNPRVVKIKMSKFAKKRPHHARPPPLLRTFLEAVVILN